MLLLLALGFHRQAAADEARAVAGQRIFYTGHSFHMFVPPLIDQLASAAGIQEHKTTGAQGIGGSRVIQHWDLTDDKNKAKAALTGGAVDVFTMAPHTAIPDDGITKFVELGLKHNPKMRFVIQASWYPYDVAAPEQRPKDNVQRDAMKIEALQATIDEWRQRMETQADELNKLYGHRAVFIVPVGDAVVRLRAMIVAGKFPGITEQSKLFRDAIGHGQGQVMALAAYCDFAAIYKISPVGLKLAERGVSAEQHAILQKLAWDTVSNYPYSGIATRKD